MPRKRTFNFSKQNKPVDTNINTKIDSIPVSNIENEKFEENSPLRYNMREKNNPTININSQGLNIQGHLNQGSPVFGIYSGKQCVAISLLSILFSKLYDIRSWTSDTLDRILHIGTELYALIRNSSRINNDYILINELPQLLHVDALNTTFNLDISMESEVGLIGVEKYSNQDVGKSLFGALQTSLFDYESCFITFGGNTFSGMKINDRLYVFDSHSRSITGLVSPFGTSVLIEMNDINSLYNHCMNLSASMNLPQNSQFEITGINVTIPHNEYISQNEIKSERIIDKESRAENDLIDHGSLLNHSEISNSCVQTPNNDESSDEVVQSNVEYNSMLFFPFTLERRNELSDYIGLAKDNTHEAVTKRILYAPKTIKNITDR